MTAEEYFKEHLSGEPLHQDVVIEAMIEFTKYHVKQALKIASEKVELYKFNNGWKASKQGIKTHEDMNYTVAIDSESILTAYPLENIK